MDAVLRLAVVVLVVAFVSLALWTRRLVREVKERQSLAQRNQDSEARYQDLVETSQDLIWQCDAEGRYVYLNPAWEGVFGYRLDEMLGQPFANFQAPESVAPDALAFARLLRGDSLRGHESVHRARDGRDLHLVFNAKPVLDRTGQIVGTRGTAYDITARKWAEQALADSMARLRTVVADAPIVLYSFDRRGIFTLSEGKGLAGLGLRPGEIVGRSISDVYGNQPEALAALRRALAGETFTLELSFPSGAIFEVSHSALHDANGEYDGTVGILLDISERRQAEAALRVSEDLLRRSQSVAQLGSYYFDIGAGTWICTPALDDLFGIDERFAKTVEGWVSLVHPAHQEEMADHLMRHVLRDHHRFEKEYRIRRHSDGEERWVLGLGELEFGPDGQPIRMIGTIQDITERRHAQDAWRESETRFTVFMENLPAGAFMKDVPGAVVYANRYLCDLFGWGEVIGRATSQLLPPDVAAKMEADDRAALEKGLTTVTEQVRDVHGHARVFQTSKFPIAREGMAPLLGGIAVDVTERIRVEEALRASLKEKEVLLKEVHHRVKNNLQIVSSLLNLQAQKMQTPELQAFLRDTQGRIRAMSLLHETLYGSADLASISFRDYVRTVCAQVLRSYQAGALSVDLQQDVLEVMLPIDQAIPAGLVLNELVSNALKHAFAGRTHGTLTVQLRAADDRHYALSVADDGVGLPVDVEPRQAEALGLRLVDSLVRQLDGTLVVHREAGTRFEVTFPRDPS